jgi:5'-3' exonuclease
MLKYGLRPSQLADLVGLMGDAADNIPGVKGVGLKSGAALLQVIIWTITTATTTTCCL